jgi:hypothetical protein
MNKEELLDLWKKRLEQFENDSHIAKGMDSRTAMGVQHGRTLCLKDCIKELESLKD